MHKRWIGFVVIAVTVIASALAWPYLPERVTTHWNLAGEPDSDSPRWIAALMVPGMLLVFRGLAQVLPRIDPRWANYARFFDTYWLLINGIMIFMGAIHLVVLVNGLGWALPVGKLVPAAVGLLFVMLGNYLPRVQSNWFLGIRTPWTLSSDKVWRKTHRVSGALFVLGGIGMMVVAFLPRAIVLPVFIVILVLVGVVPVVLSYLYWRKEQHNAAI